MLTGVTKIMTVLPFALPNDVMFKKSDDSAHVDINLSTTEHAFTESFESVFIYCCEYGTIKT